MYNKIIFIISLVIISVFCGIFYEKQQFSKIIIKQQEAYNLKIQKQQIENNIVLESYMSLQNDYKQQVRDKLNEINKNKDLINRNNVITREFVQYTSIKRANMQTESPAKTSNSNGRISAVQYGEWIIGLQEHDYACVNQLNSILEIINKDN